MIETKQVIAIVASAAAVTVVQTAEASADYVGSCAGACWQYASARSFNGQNFEYEVERVGYCGYQSGGIVRGDQSLLWASGMYGAPSGNKNKVDGAFGSQTYNAITGFQYWHGIPQDGCAGSDTHYNMAHQFHITSSLPYGVRYDYYDPVANYVWGEQPHVQVVKQYDSGVPYGYVNCWWFNWSGGKTWSAPGYPENRGSYWYANDLGFELHNNAEYSGQWTS